MVVDSDKSVILSISLVGKIPWGRFISFNLYVWTTYAFHIYRAHWQCCPKNHIRWWFSTIKSRTKSKHFIFVSRSIITDCLFSVNINIYYPMTISKQCATPLYPNVQWIYLNSNNINRKKYKKLFRICNKILQNISEPIGSVKPNVNDIYKTNIASGGIHRQISLTCPAMSYPIPSFR